MKLYRPIETTYHVRYNNSAARYMGEKGTNVRGIINALILSRAGAIAYAHTQGVCHAVMLTKTGKIRIIK